MGGSLAPTVSSLIWLNFWFSLDPTRGVLVKSSLNDALLDAEDEGQKSALERCLLNDASVVHS